MPMTPQQIEIYVDAAASALRLPLQPEHRPGVLRYFALAAELAELLNEHPLGPHDDPAEAFVPMSPPAPGSTA